MSNNTVEAIHLSTCDKHEDLHDPRRRCNALTGSGHLCQNEPTVFVAEHLPVCHDHQSQAGSHRYAQCLATERCGFRCNRACDWDHTGDRSPTCDMHRDAQLLCFLNRLPTELLIMIMEFLVPNGSVPPKITKNKPNPYSAICALAQVNREMATHVDTVFYHNAEHKCVLWIEGAGVLAVAGQFYRLSIGHPSESPGFRVMQDISKSCLTRFSHFEIIVDPKMVGYCVSTILYLLSAMSSLRTAPQGSNRRIPQVTLKMGWHIYIQPHHSVATHDDLIEYVVTRMRSILMATKLFSIQLDWKVKLTVIGTGGFMGEIDHGKAWITLTSRDQQTGLTGWMSPIMQRAVNKFRANVESLRFYDRLAITPSWLASETARWHTFQKILGIVRELVEIGFVDHLTQEPKPRTFQETVHSKFLKCANIPLESDLISSFDILTRKVDRLWADFVAQHEEKFLALHRHFAHFDQASHGPATISTIMDRPLEQIKLCDVVSELEKELRDAAFSRWQFMVPASQRAAMSSDDWAERSHTFGGISYAERQKVYWQCARAAAKVREGQTTLRWDVGVAIEAKDLVVVTKRPSKLGNTNAQQLKITLWTVRLPKAARRLLRR